MSLKEIKEINLAAQNLGCYKGFMADKDVKRDALVGAMVADSSKQELQRIADAEDRSLSYIASAFIMRGLAAYLRDGLLKEPQVVQSKTVKAEIIEGYKPKVKNDKKRA